MTYIQKLAASSTFSVNRASAVWPAVVYMTQLGHEMAVPPHNDRQDVRI